MDKLEQLLSDANERLRKFNAGIRILKRGERLALRGMLPKEDVASAKKSQQVVSLGIYFNAAGIKSAEKQAQKLATQIAFNEFKWSDWRSEKQSISSVDYWIEKFERNYFDRREKNDRTMTTWTNDYLAMFKRLNPSDSLEEKTLIDLITSTKPDSRQRKRAVLVANSLAKFAKLEIDFNRYKGNYSHLSNGDRLLPSDEQIASYYKSIVNPHWQRAFALMACYGVSNHELFYVELDSLKHPPGHLISNYRKDHYGTRRIWCLYPEWYEQWKLYEPIALPNVSGKNNRALGQRVTSAFARYGLCKPGDLRHCWAIRAMGFMPDSMAARMMAHTTKVHNDTYKRWMNENQEDNFYQLLQKRSDRPKPPITS